MFDLIGDMISLVFDLFGMAMSLAWGAVELVFGLLGGILSLVLSLGGFVLLGALILIALRRRKNRTNEPEPTVQQSAPAAEDDPDAFDSFYDQYRTQA